MKMLEAISKMQLQVERQIKTQKLPKAEIMSLDGNPLSYYLFIKRLKETIKGCGTMSGKDGYVKAKKLLEERFGQKCVMSNALIVKLSEGPPINQNDREGLLYLADDLKVVKSPLPLRVDPIRLTRMIR